ncbi:MAG: PfkB family carbohydrate kinase [Gaiellales bacterium]
MILCVAPNPSIDKLFAVDRLVPGAIHRPKSIVQVAGGKGLNVARAAAALGADVHAVAVLGGYAGRWLAAELGREGISLTAVWTSHESRSCLSVADTETSSLTEFYERGLPIEDTEWAELVDVVRELGATASWTTVSGSTPPGAGGAFELATMGTVALDTNELGDARPALLKVNAMEAAALTGLVVTTLSAAAEAATALRARIGGAGHGAVVTLGREGAVAVTPAGAVLRASLDVTGDYPVGSGDAFLAGLVVSLERDPDWGAALATAIGAGAANAEIPGAGRLDGARARELARRASIAPLA